MMKKGYMMPQVVSDRKIFVFAMMQSSTTTAITGLSECSATCCHEQNNVFTTAHFCATGNSESVQLSDLSIRVELDCLAESDQSVVETLNFTVDMGSCSVVSDADDSSCPDGSFLIACDEALSCADFQSQHPCSANTDYADTVTLSIEGADAQLACSGPVSFEG